LEEKEKKEKEMRSQIIEEAGEYKVEFYRKREVNVENNKASNREREKVNFVLHICSIGAYFCFGNSIKLKFTSVIESYENFKDNHCDN